MLPTLKGRWLTRILLFLWIGLPVTFVFSLLIAGPGSARLPLVGVRFEILPFQVLSLLLLVGLVLDPVYIYFQQFRWERDWPFAFQFFFSIIEFVIVLGLIWWGALDFTHSPLDLHTTENYLLIVLLSLVALSLVITLIPNYAGFGSATSDVSVIAEIGGEKVTAMEVRQALERAMRDRSLPREMVSVYVPMIAQQMIASKAVAFQAERMGFRVSDAEAVEIIRSILPSLFQNGQFVGRENYAAMLAQQNMTIPMFEANVKKQAAATRLEVMSLEGVIVTPQEVEDAFRKKNDRIVISYASISEEKYKPQVAVSPDEIKALYEQRKANFTIPEKRSFLVYPIEEAKLAATIAVADEQLKQAYNGSLDSFRTPERVKVRHILLKTEGKSEAEVAAIQKKTEELLKQVKGGADFAQIATKNSEDTGSAVRRRRPRLGDARPNRS